MEIKVHNGDLNKAMKVMKRKLQQDEGRWLKLVSALVVITLGLLLLLAPDWLF